jgi:hypothetical protein
MFDIFAFCYETEMDKLWAEAFKGLSACRVSGEISTAMSALARVNKRQRRWLVWF